MPSTDHFGPSLSQGTNKSNPTDPVSVDGGQQQAHEARKAGERAATRSTPGQPANSRSAAWQSGTQPRPQDGRYSFLRGDDARGAIKQHQEMTLGKGGALAMKAVGMLFGAPVGLMNAVAAQFGVVKDNVTGRIVPGYLDDDGILRQAPELGYDDANDGGEQLDTLPGAGGGSTPSGQPTPTDGEGSGEVPQWLIDLGYTGEEVPAEVTGFEAFMQAANVREGVSFANPTGPRTEVPRSRLSARSTSIRASRARLGVL